VDCLRAGSGVDWSLAWGGCVDLTLAGGGGINWSLTWSSVDLALAGSGGIDLALTGSGGIDLAFAGSGGVDRSLTGSGADWVTLRTWSAVAVTIWSAVWGRLLTWGGSGICVVWVWGDAWVGWWVLGLG